MVELDYLVIGHVTRDLVDGAFTIGGTVSYAARTASALGCRVGVVTSASPELDPGQVLEGALVARFPAAATTTFENIYTPNGRRQILHTVAARLTPEMVPSHWQVAPARTIVHLGPVARECDPALVSAFGDAFVGLTPQGWMRRWDQDGRVSRRRWEEAEKLLPRADAVVMSEEDVAGDETLMAQYAAQTRLLVVTRGKAGCTVYESGQSRRFPAPAVREVDPTGSGDVFAAAFFLRLQRGGDPWMAARFANCVAARSVTRQGLSGTPRPEEIARCEQALERK
ncbi:MAG: ribokinase [Chloroflexi bacterium]|jgi:sugar/nucleoside kinase (ribokinase family)|nr:ribokinase [Chloroflexota bacterium]